MELKNSNILKLVRIWEEKSFVLDCNKSRIHILIWGVNVEE